MAKAMRLGKNREQKGAARSVVMRSRREGEDVADIARNHPDDPRGYIDTEYDDHGEMVTDPATIPRP